MNIGETSNLSQVVKLNFQLKFSLFKLNIDSSVSQLSLNQPTLIITAYIE